MQYRRSNAIGGTFFFTVNLQDRSSRLLTKHIDVLRESVRKVCHSHHVDIVAMVVLPDHLHAIWTLPPGDFNYPIRWSLIKAGFSRKMETGEPANSSRRHKRERGIWERHERDHVADNVALLPRLDGVRHPSEAAPHLRRTEPIHKTQISAHARNLATVSCCHKCFFRLFNHRKSITPRRF